MPGQDWFLQFKNRHHLSIKIAQAVEFSRRKVLDPFIIYRYFDVSTECLDNGKYMPEQIWNLDKRVYRLIPQNQKLLVKEMSRLREQ